MWKKMGGLYLAVAMLAIESSSVGYCQEMPPVRIDVGDEAPAFKCLDNGGWIWNSTDKLSHKYLVLVFYQGDFHKGSNQRLAAYRDKLVAFVERDVDVVGVSGDTVATHQLYKDLFALNFLLLADVDGKVARAFALTLKPGGKARVTYPDGKPYPPNSRYSHKVSRGVTCQPRTFIIAPEGTVVHTQIPTDPISDCQAILKFIDEHADSGESLP